MVRITFGPSLRNLFMCFIILGNTSLNDWKTAVCADNRCNDIVLVTFLNPLCTPT